MTPNQTTKGMSEAEVLATFDELTKGRFMWHGDIDMRVSARSTIESTFAELAQCRRERDDMAWKAEHREVLFNQRNQLVRDVQRLAQAEAARADTAESDRTALRNELAELRKSYELMVDSNGRLRIERNAAALELAHLRIDLNALLEMVRRLLPYARDQVSTYGREHCGAGKKAIAAAEAILSRITAQPVSAADPVTPSDPASRDVEASR